MRTSFIERIMHGDASKVDSRAWASTCWLGLGLGSSSGLWG
jgi:hypothetical protein